MEQLELRLYGLVPYNISPIQQGIQFGHAKDEFTVKVIKSILDEEKGFPQYELDRYLDWIKFWKTYIILSGGTTNLNVERPGTLNQHLQTLRDRGIFCSEFHEPDLGDQLTGVVFIVDERVFNRQKYPDFNFQLRQTDLLNPQFVCEDEKLDFEDWQESIGGPKNYFLRNFLPNFRLA